MADLTDTWLPFANNRPGLMRQTLEKGYQSSEAPADAKWMLTSALNPSTSNLPVSMERKLKFTRASKAWSRMTADLIPIPMVLRSAPMPMREKGRWNEVASGMMLNFSL